MNTIDKQRILVVDDDPRIVRFIRLKLVASGYQVFTATGGEEALKLVKVAHPDIMILDIIMPGIDGFKVLRKICSISSLPVIAISARSENGPEALSLGACDFVVKPFDVDNLVEMVEKKLG